MSAYVGRAWESFSDGGRAEIKLIPPPLSCAYHDNSTVSWSMEWADDAVARYSFPRPDAISHKLKGELSRCRKLLQ